MKLKENMVINCKTQEYSEVLLKECSKQGINTKSNADATRLGIKGFNVWEQFKENTCYSIERSSMFNGLKIEFDDIKYYESNGYKITDFDNLFKIDSKIKVGYIVKVIDSGKQYATYKDFINNKLPKRLNDFKFGDMVNYDNEYKVIFIGKHENYNEHICVIEDLNTKQIFMIQDIGIEVIKEAKKMSKCKVYEMPEYVENEIKKVIINEPCVIVILNSGEKGVAKCCPEDKFNEVRGYKIALERAMKEKYLNAVVRQDEIIKQYINDCEKSDSIGKHMAELRSMWTQ